jgi:hypothetical protein
MLDQVNAIVQNKFPNYTYVHPESVLVQATVAASQGAGVAANASMTINGTATTNFTIPQSQVWVISDIFNTSSSSTATDATVSFVKNGVKTLTITAPLSANLVSNNTRPGLFGPLLYEPNTSLTLPTAPVAAAGTTTTTDTFFITVTIYDATYA